MIKRYYFISVKKTFDEQTKEFAGTIITQSWFCKEPMDIRNIFTNLVKEKLDVDTEDYLLVAFNKI